MERIKQSNDNGKSNWLKLDKQIYSFFEQIENKWAINCTTAIQDFFNKF